MIRRSNLRTSQPQTLVRINPKYAKYVTTARLWSVTPTLSVDSRLSYLTPFSKTGTVDVNIVHGAVGVQGDGSTGLYSRASNLTPQAMWIAVQFVAATVTTAQKTAYALGSAYVGTGAYCGVFSGNSTTSEITAQLRAVDTAAAISKVGPTPEAGKTYTVIAVFPSALKADAYMYVNGVKYTTDYTSSSDITFVGANTLVNEAVGALKRGTTAVYGSDVILFTARGVGQIPEALARQISLNPYSLLQEQQRNIYASGAGGSPTVITLDPAALNLTPQNTQNALNAALTASALNLTPQDIQNSVTNNLTAVAFDFVAHDITAENASTATVTLDTATFDFVANDNQSALYAELSTATCDFVTNDAQALTAHSLDVCAFDFVGQDTQNHLGLLLENAIFDFATRSITAGDPLAPTTGRATNLMLMGVGN